MGRCNNARAQQAAANSASKPTRARFSTWTPPGRGGKSGRGGRGGRGGDEKPKRDAPNSTKTAFGNFASAITKIESRQAARKSTGMSVATGGKAQPKNAFDTMDLSKLDAIELTDQSQALVYSLLVDLNIISSHASEKKETVASEKLKSTPSQHSLSAPVFNHDGDDHEDIPGSSPDPDSYTQPSYTDEDVIPGTNQPTKKQSKPTSSSYTEHEDDYDDFPPSRSPSASPPASRSPSPTPSRDLPPPLPLASENPIFKHLTQRLSFSLTDATKAVNLSASLALAAPEPEPAAPVTNLPDKNLLAAALDYLCLHLSETDLNKGFQPNKKKPPTSFLPRPTTGPGSKGEPRRTEKNTSSPPCALRAAQNEL